MQRVGGAPCNAVAQKQELSVLTKALTRNQQTLAPRGTPLGQAYFDVF